jgi:hypothetical protein
MHLELLSLFAKQSLGVAVGVFIGAIIGLSVRAKRAGTKGLYKDSVYATAFLASMLAFAAMTLIRLITFKG